LSRSRAWKGNKRFGNAHSKGKTKMKEILSFSDKIETPPYKGLEKGNRAGSLQACYHSYGKTNSMRVTLRRHSPLQCEDGGGGGAFEKAGTLSGGGKTSHIDKKSRNPSWLGVEENNRRNIGTINKATSKNVKCAPLGEELRIYECDLVTLTALKITLSVMTLNGKLATSTLHTWGLESCSPINGT